MIAGEPTSKTRHSVFPLIDVLRGFAAISVVVFHLIAHFGWTSFPVSGPLVWFRIGWLGVDLFFVISGFVIALSAFSTLNSIDAGQQSPNRHAFARKFVRARLARIVPLYYATCLVFIVFLQPFMIFTLSGWAQFATHALFIHNLILSHQGGINGVNWSLATEMQFYLLMLVAAPWLRRAHPLYIALGGLGIAWTWRTGVFFLTEISGPLGPFPRFVWSTQLPGMLDEFAAGILLARFVSSESGRHFTTQNPHRFWIVPLVAIGTLVVGFRIYWQGASYWDLAQMVIGFRSIAAMACTSIILLACCYNHPAIVRATALPRYLGTISYGIYLWHLLVVLAFHRLSWLAAPRAIIPVIGVTILFAALSWHLFEKPLLVRFGRRGNAVSRPNGHVPAQ